MTGADLTCLTSRTQGGYRTADDKLYASMSEDADVEDANKAEVLRVRIQFEHRAKTMPCLSLKTAVSLCNCLLNFPTVIENSCV